MARLDVDLPPRVAKLLALLVPRRLEPPLLAVRLARRYVGFAPGQTDRQVDINLVENTNPGVAALIHGITASSMYMCM